MNTTLSHEKKIAVWNNYPKLKFLLKMILHVVELKMEMQEIFLHLQAYLKKIDELALSTFLYTQSELFCWIFPREYPFFAWIFPYDRLESN